ncbi:MAG: hypothetical protein J0J01_01130 [Reyranella sp.]|uniref:hypothetical protein n=1 Tax=Reyranella sp. TaxID=1929291 RepID=UPI001AC90BE4|nr:hypothetical protein [Reyranella sp.]MBN9085482.1 hypothetical protein [Reyranella sp.]
MLLIVSLFLLVVTLLDIWPTGRSPSWMEFAGIGILAFATLSVVFWAIGTWIGDTDSAAGTDASLRAEEEAGFRDRTAPIAGRSSGRAPFR